MPCSAKSPSTLMSGYQNVAPVGHAGEVSWEPLIPMFSQNLVFQLLLFKDTSFNIYFACNISLMGDSWPAGQSLLPE